MLSQSVKSGQPLSIKSLLSLRSLFQIVADLSFRNVLGLNQQTYQRLKLALSLNLRRQVFIAVCDDLALRDRMANQILAELNAPSISPQTLTSEEGDGYPRLVRLHLNLSDPNLIAQIADWLVQYPPPKRKSGISLPIFQFVGIEHLTRQPAAIQRLFFAHLQGIERSLPVLESGLLLWMPRPWVHALSQSTPTFWRCRTGVFEFIGDPTPISTVNQDPRSIGVSSSVYTANTGYGDRPQTPTVRLDSTAPDLSSQVAQGIDRESEDNLNPSDSKQSIIKLSPIQDPKSSLDEAGISDTENHENCPPPPNCHALEQRTQTVVLPASVLVQPKSALHFPKRQSFPIVTLSRGTQTDQTAQTGDSVLLPLTNGMKNRPHNGHSTSAEQATNGQSTNGHVNNGHAANGQVVNGQVVNKHLAVSGQMVNGQALSEQPGSDQGVHAQIVTNAPVKVSTPLLTEGLAEEREDAATEALKPNAILQTQLGRENQAIQTQAQPSPFQNLPQNLPLLQQIELLHQQQASPVVLAEAYRTLGNLYRDRIEQGDASAQNLTVAIHAYEQVLVWLHETSPAWTDVLNDLGNLYWMLSRATANSEEALQTLQKSIQAYQMALTKLNLQTQPHAYPMIQNNLGAAYADLARYRDPVTNLQQSIQAYQQTLRHRKPDTDPSRYASTQNNLGTTYWNLAQHQQPEVYLKQAIAAYSEALHYYDPNQEPMNYAMIQNNLGTAYWNLAQFERPQDWLRLALAAYRMALKYRTLDAAPASFAATQNNLGTAYWHMATQVKENPIARSEYLQEAIAAYEAALLGIQKISGNPQAAPLTFDVFATHNNLGLAHYQLATDPRIILDASLQTSHLERSLQHHLRALDGWQAKSELRQTALSCSLQAIRALYSQCGLEGQNLALAKIPGHLLTEILSQL